MDCDYNLRGSARYRNLAANWEATRPTVIRLGERRKPNPQGRPGYLRIDTVHQGDCINAVEEVT